MTSSGNPWDDAEEDLPAAALPTIRRDAPLTRVSAVPAPEPDPEEDAGADLWVEDSAAPVASQTLSAQEESPWSDDTGASSWGVEASEADAMLLQMQGVVAEVPDDLPDPDALFLQMQGLQATVAEEDLPDPDALFLQMKAAEAAVAEEDLPDPDALFLQMKATEAAVTEEDLPDPDALFLQMKAAEAAVAEEDLPDPDALFLQMKAAEAAVTEEDLPDPDALFLQMQALEEPLRLLREGETEQARASTDEPDLPDPDALFLRMKGATEGAAPPLEALFLRRSTPEELLETPAAVDLPHPESLLLETPTQEPLPENEAEVDLPDSDALFLQMQSRREPSAPVLDLPASDALLLQMRAEAQAESRSPSLMGDDDLPDPNALFMQMQAREAEIMPPSEVDDLPDSNALFLQMQASLPPETPAAPVFASPIEGIAPLPEPEIARPRGQSPPREEKAGLFSRLKARFTREKNLPEVPDLPEPLAGSAGMVAGGVGAGLPDPAELFRRMQIDEDEEDLELSSTATSSPSSPLPSPSELFQRLQDEELESSGESAAQTPDGLPALPDLDALRAEMEAEERARLDPDLLGDLSGPERFAETVSDLAFNAGTFFQAPPEKGSVHKAPEHKQPKHPPRESVPEEPLPAMLSAAPPPAKPVGPAAPRPSEDSAGAPPPGPVAAPVYRATPKPAKAKASASTVIIAGKEDGPTRTAAKPPPFWKRNKRPVLSRLTLSVITRQMAAMLKAGIPLNMCVAFCAESDPEAQPLLEDVARKIESGFSYSSALREYPESFDAVYVGLVHAGELSGRLNEMLLRLADILERELNLRKRLISVITYPAVLLAVSMLGTLGFIFFVLPQLTPMFTSLEVDLPWPTKILLSLRDVLLPGTLLLGAIGALAFAFRGKLQAYIQAKPALERKLAYIPLSLPVLGPVYDKIITARVLYSLSTMLEVGVTMNQALARAENATGNAYVGYRLARARADLADGSSVSECFMAHRVFPETALHLIAAGEESARMVEMFQYVARYFDEEVEQTMETAAGMLEPLIMVVMGVIVGFITIAAAMPTIQLLQNF